MRAVMDHLADALRRAVDDWDERGWPRPDVMVFSGSGLSTRLGDPVLSSSWAEVLPFPVRGIEGHSLEIEIIRPTEDRIAVSSRGRLHYYQGYTPAEVVFPVRLGALLGARVLLLTNSSGGLREELRAGHLVLLRDHLNLMGMNPLHGRMPAEWGPQFPDMGSAYDPRLRELFRSRAEALELDVREGVYAGMAGPSYETPAEVRMLGGLGADVVGMSTVPEVIAAHHMGLRCACLSVVSNPGAGLSDEVLDHADVLERGQEASQKAGRLLADVLARPEL